MNHSDSGETPIGPAEEVLADQLDRYLESLRHGAPNDPRPSGGDSWLIRLRPVVDGLFDLARLLDSASAPLDGCQPETGDHHSLPESQRWEGQIGKHQLVRLLGEGGQGSTYLAFDTDLKRHVVLKVYHEARTPQAQEAILREGQALARVRSPYVAQCFSAERHEGLAYLVLEYIPGQSLAKRLALKALPLDQALELTGRLAEGLAEVHACGLLHRDLKPGNVLLGDDGLPRLVDFGLAVPFASAALRQVSGTLAYIAPEQARGDYERIDPRSDIFGLGAVLYELLTGRPPHEGRTRKELWEAACAGEVVPALERNPRLPVAASHLCMRCLARDPGKRFASAADLARALRQLRQSRRAVSRRCWIGLAAVAVALVAVGIGLWRLGPTAAWVASNAPAPAATTAEEPAPASRAALLLGRLHLPR